MFDALCKLNSVSSSKERFPGIACLYAEQKSTLIFTKITEASVVKVIAILRGILGDLTSNMRFDSTQWQVPRKQGYQKWRQNVTPKSALDVYRNNQNPL